MKRLLIIILVFLSLAFKAASNDVLFLDSSLSSERQICLKAQNDANAYHGHREIDFVIGFFTGPFAVITSLIISYEINEKTKILSENKKYFSDSVYIECFTARAQRNRLISNLWGWLASTLVICFFAVIYHYMD